ncbi:hypothetical protein AVEN_32451-1 [Araneus ventricosus]|uniref:Uncharacterized protein n=1 Tax=Araneus ventricosus TaxID=182803 RepID=A0A4Y2PNU5_ARAVE|nr:hypothetical protein AVEN_32451-1 [Araneus ventricosus]
MCHTSVHWVSALPAVLLLFRNPFSKKIPSAPLLKWYMHENLHQAHFSSNSNHKGRQWFHKETENYIQQRGATPTSNISANPLLYTKILCVHMSFCVDAVQPSLSQPYTGPIKFCHEQIKNFIILKDNKKVTVTSLIDLNQLIFFDNVNSSEVNLTLLESTHHLPPSSAKEPENQLCLCLQNRLYIHVLGWRVHSRLSIEILCLKNYRSNFFPGRGWCGGASVVTHLLLKCKMYLLYLATL